jgi:hypothetical protein
VRTPPPAPARLLGAPLLIALVASGGAGAQEEAPKADSAVFAGTAVRSDEASGAAQKVSAALAWAFESHAVSDLSAAPGGAERPGQSTESLSRLLSDARGRYLEGDFDGAVTQATDAAKRFEQSLAYEPADEAWKTYAELMLVRSLALNRQGKRKDADRTLAELAALRPDYVPDPGLAPPKFASRYASIRDRLKKREVAIDASSRPAGAKVFVDGIERCIAPCQVPGLLAGRHYVSMRLGEQRKDQAVFLRDGSAQVAATLGDPRKQAAEALLLEVRRGGTAEALAPLAADAGAKVYVALLEPGAGEYRALLGRFAGGTLETVTGIVFSDDMSDLDDRAVRLADAAVAATGDGWVDAADLDAAEARRLFLNAAGSSATPGGGEGGGGGAGLWIGVGVGVGVVAVVAAAATVGVVLYLNQPPNPGGIDLVIDASQL